MVLSVSLVGRQLGDRYRLEELIGQGGMAVVYQAVDLRSGRSIALKLLRDAYNQDPDAILRFQREAKAALALHHANIVETLDAGELEGQHYIAMERVAGENLRAYLDGRGALPPAEAVRIAGQVAEGLAAAHRLGLIHRDVKPSNILLTPRGDAKLTDFGIVHTLGSAGTTTAGVVLGSAQYLSPEQARGQPVDARSDLYALGIVLYEMLTGRVPFRADSALGLLQQQIEADPTPPHQVRPGIPPEIEQVVLRAMQKDRRARFASAEEFKAALQRALIRSAATHDAPTTAEPIWLASAKSLPPVGRGASPMPPGRRAELPGILTPRLALVVLGAVALFVVAVGLAGTRTPGPVAVNEGNPPTAVATSAAVQTAPSTANDASVPPPVIHPQAPVVPPPAAQPQPPGKAKGKK